MNAEVLNLIIDMIFTGFMPYVAPIIFLFVVLAFSDRLVSLIMVTFNLGK